MSADIERITNGWQTMHECWANPIEVGIAIYLLERQLGPACAIPLGVAIGKLNILAEHHVPIAVSWIRARADSTSLQCLSSDHYLS